MRLILNGGGDGKSVQSARQLLNRLIDNNKNVEYIKKQIKEYPEILPLVLVLKRYMKRMLMDNVYYGGISSFSILALSANMIFFNSGLSTFIPLSRLSFPITATNNDLSLFIK